MCGIAGFVRFQGQDQAEATATIGRMTRTMHHRGPDADGLYVDELAGLGHRRLAIIDLAQGAQPMASQEGDLLITFNGEIYNYQELRRRLEAQGHCFATQSDTESILLAYRQWGAACVERLHGMFAFALWDRSCRTLLLARDRVGKKPLYYFRQGDALYFASTLKALRACGSCPSELSPRALDCYFSFGYIPAPDTIYHGVHKLPAAHCLELRATGASLRRYWDLSFAAPRPRSLAEAGEEFAELLDRAVADRLMSEVPLGAFLSGGLDSTLVVESMARHLSGPVLTNTIGFGDPRYSELEPAGLVARQLATDHREFLVTPQLTETLPAIASHFDEPFADSSAVPTYHVCRMARQRVTVALSGDGGDEGFGGYTFRYLPHLAEARLRRLLPTLLRVGFFGALGRLYPGAAWLPRPLRLKTILENLARSDSQAFYHDLIWLREDTRDRLYQEEFAQALRGFSPMEVVAPLYQGSDGPDPLSRCQDTDLQLYLCDDVLVKVDRMSMAHSLEVRSPLLDHRILEFAATLPATLKIDQGRGKIVLRHLAAQRLPPEILKMPKRGFSIPAGEWLRGELRPLAEQAIFRRDSRLRELLRADSLHSLWREHQGGQRDHSVFLWGLMMFALWEQGQ